MTGDVVLAGASLSLSGSLSVQGEQAHRGLELWATSAGADGIVVGGAKRPVELVVFDDESKPARARRNTEKLLEDGAEILFRPYGSAFSTFLRRLVMAANPASASGGNSPKAGAT